MPDRGGEPVSIEARIMKLADELVRLAGQVHAVEQDNTRRWHARSVIDHAQQTAYHAGHLIKVVDTCDKL